VAISQNVDETEMAIYTADLKWTASEGEDFLKGRFSRAHTLSFDGGTVVPASASPHVVGKWAAEAAVDPEEMLVAALSSCHMLSFLHVARLAGFAVAAYDDHAEGVLEEIAPGRQAVAKVALHPRIAWAGAAPGKEELERLHHEAHQICFIANSVKTRVTIE
jgi:organic hydroperoxide reductase OsmC/OhrA